MKTNSKIIRKAAIDLHGLDHTNVVKVAGVVKKVVNWIKGFGDPEFQRKLEELQDMSPAIKGTVDALSVEIDKLNKALSNTDPEQFGQSLEQVRPLISELAESLSDLDQKASEAEAEAPLDAVVNEKGQVISGEDVKKLEQGWKQDAELVDKMKSMLPDGLDVPVKSHINKPLMDFEWFQQFGPDNIRFSEYAKQLAVDKIASLIFNIEDIPTDTQSNIIGFLNRNKEFIVNKLRDNILNGILRSYNMPSVGQPNKMTVVVDAGTINVPGIDFEVQFPTVFMQDKFTTFTPVKELDVYNLKNVKPYSAPKNINIELDEGLIRDVIKKNDWNIAASARELGISDRSLRRKMQGFGIVREEEPIVQEPDPVDAPGPDVESEPVQAVEMAEDGDEDDIEFAEPEFVDGDEDIQQAIASRTNEIEKLGKVTPGSYDSIASIPGLEAKSPEFQRELIATGNRLGLDPSFLASVMFAESGLDHTAVNPVGGATGLIQFMPSTAKGLGTSTEKLASMSDVEQLRYVEKFFKPFASKIRNAGDLRMAAFLPKFIGVPSDTIVGQKGNYDSIAGKLTYHKVWEYNQGLDSDKDGIIRAVDVTGKANAIHRAAIKRGAVRPEGGETSGYVRMINAPGADVQQQAQRILNNIRHQPIGTTVPFSMNGVDYMAKLETHSAGPRNSKPHPGISLFYKPQVGGAAGGSNPLAPMGLPSEQFGGSETGIDPRSQREISKLDSRIQPLARQIILRGKAIGLNPVIVSGLRSQTEQDRLYEQGRNTPGNVVTNTRSSMHTKGLAFDIAELDENGSITWSPKDTQFWDKMGTVGKSLGLTWGGDFRTFKDRPHFQYNVNGEIPSYENRRPSFMADNKKQQQVRVIDGDDARELFNFLYASGPIEKMVRRAIYKKALPTTRVLTTIGSSDLPFHTRVRFAKILSSALRTEFDAESSIHNYDDKIEIESDISGSQSAVMRAVKGLSEGISEAFELSTEKCGEYKISTRAFANVKSAYALIASETMETSFRKFAFDMVSK